MLDKSKILTKYEQSCEKLLVEKQQYAEAENRCKEARIRLEVAEREFEKAKKELEASYLDKPTVRQDSIPERASVERIAFPRSIRSTIDVFPKDGSGIAMEELRRALDLSDGAINTRIQKAKRQHLVETAGWGRYKLTNEGKRAVLSLRVVPPVSVEK